MRELQITKFGSDDPIQLDLSLFPQLEAIDLINTGDNEVEIFGNEDPLRLVSCQDENSKIRSLPRAHSYVVTTNLINFLWSGLTKLELRFASCDHCLNLDLFPRLQWLHMNGSCVLDCRILSSSRPRFLSYLGAFDEFEICGPAFLSEQYLESHQREHLMYCCQVLHRHGPGSEERSLDPKKLHRLRHFKMECPYTEVARQRFVSFILELPKLKVLYIHVLSWDPMYTIELANIFEALRNQKLGIFLLCQPPHRDTDDFHCFVDHRSVLIKSDDDESNLYVTVKTTVSQVLSIADRLMKLLTKSDRRTPVLELLASSNKK